MSLELELLFQNENLKLIAIKSLYYIIVNSIFYLISVRLVYRNKYLLFTQILFVHQKFNVQNLKNIKLLSFTIINR